MFDNYKLSDEIHNAILQAIKDDCFLGKRPVANPEIFILGGQPGAGKSVLTQKIQNSINSSNVIIINSDEFRLNHPQAQEIFQKHSKDFAVYTDPDVRVWGKDIFDEAIAKHYNIIFEGTMRTTQICDTIKHLQKEGYKINILAMAVPEIKSRVSIYSRYQEQLDRYPIARFTNRFSHDAAYYGMLDTLKLIEKEHLYDTITICNRNADVLFKTGDVDVVAAINKERERPLSSEDKHNLIENCNWLLDKMHARNEEKSYIDDLTSLRNEVLSPSENHNLTNSVQDMHNKVTSLRASKPTPQDTSKTTTITQQKPKTR